MEMVKRKEQETKTIIRRGRLSISSGVRDSFCCSTFLLFGYARSASRLGKSALKPEETTRSDRSLKPWPWWCGMV